MFKMHLNIISHCYPMYGNDQPRQNKSKEWYGLNKAMNELDRDWIAKHFDFELLLEGSDLGGNSGYGDSLGDNFFYIHGYLESC